MESLYRLRYGNNRLESGNGHPSYMDAYVVQYGREDAAPMEQRYFYCVEEGPPRRRICFIKRFWNNKKRYQREKNAARISSPYVSALYRTPQMKKCRMEYCDNGIWRNLEGDILLYEYLPNDLEAFRERYTNGTEMPDTYRRDILLKLIQGVGHIHQAHIIHHDIKPGNILVNCQGLCDEAPWNCQDLDVRLADLDSVYDGNHSTPQFNVGTPPFQPEGKDRILPSVWLDIYSVCMVALWLYDSRISSLVSINQGLLETREEIEKILKGTAVPERIKDILVPHLLLAVSKMKGRPDERQWEAGAEEMSRLCQELSGAYTDDWRPMELLGPAQTPVAWSAVVQIDQEQWPVYGQGREYRMLSIMNPAPYGPNRQSWSFPGEVGSCCSNSCGDIAGVLESSSLMLSAPPEIFVAGERNGGTWALKAGIYVSINYQEQCLVQKEHIAEGSNVELHSGIPVRALQGGERLFQNVAVHSVHFYPEKEGPEPLSLFFGPARNKAATINLVFVMMASGAASGDLDCGLIRRVMDEVLKIEKCTPCCYGVTIQERGENVHSFCSGLLNPSGRTLSELYSASRGNGVGQNSSSIQNGGNVRAFDPGLPTVVIGYLDHPLDWDTDPVQRFKEKTRHLTPCFQYAVQYLQLFTTNQPDLTVDRRKLSPYLAAATDPGGACILTPLTEGEDFPDSKARWITAARYWCQRGYRRRC